jgi:hypothetical protein
LFSVSRKRRIVISTEAAHSLIGSRNGEIRFSLLTGAVCHNHRVHVDRWMKPSPGEEAVAPAPALFVVDVILSAAKDPEGFHEPLLFVPFRHGVRCFRSSVF